MKAPLTFKDRYPITTLIVSAVVAVLIHFPEVLSLSTASNGRSCSPEWSRRMS